jgi:type II secretory pathway pseudopilin PulG
MTARSATVSTRHQTRAWTAFTIVEMLVVISIIALLLGLLLPAIAGIRAESKSVACLGNLRQIFTAIELYRSRLDNLLPNAEPLPYVTPQGPQGGLNVALRSFLPTEGEHWHCPADDCCDFEEIGTSYVYVPGAWMLLFPTVGLGSAGAMIGDPDDLAYRAARTVTAQFENGLLRGLPIVADNNDRHEIGDRIPRNAVFLDGTTRLLKPGDTEIDEPGPGQ